MTMAATMASARKPVIRPLVGRNFSTTSSPTARLLLVSVHRSDHPMLDG